VICVNLAFAAKLARHPRFHSYHGARKTQRHCLHQPRNAVLIRLRMILNHQQHPTLVFWRQTRALTFAHLKCRYRKTWAGFIWVLLHPLITFTAQALVFHTILKINIENYLLFLASGLIPWIFVAQTLEMSSGIFVFSGSLIKSFPVSPLIYLAAQFFDNLINFIAGFLIALLPLWFVQNGLQWQIVLLPLPILVLSVGLFCMAWWFATLQVFLRDTRFVLTFFLQIAFFFTPIFYSSDFIPESLKWMMWINPFFHLIAPFQVLLHHFDPLTFFSSLGKAILTDGFLVLSAVRLWQKKADLVYFYV
jgi:lipopolysaccharide transport system permease protein